MTDILKLPRDDRPTTRHAGWDHCTAEPGTTEEVRCRVCGERMAVRRGVVGPTGWAHAMAIASGEMEGRPHDVFYCQSSPEAWHRQALALKLEAGRTASSGLEKLLLEEAEEIIRTRAATKEVFGSG